jgi:hypothetical protein
MRLIVAVALNAVIRSLHDEERNRFEDVEYCKSMYGITKEELDCCTEFLLQEGLCKVHVKAGKRFSGLSSFEDSAPVHGLVLVNCRDWCFNHMNRIIDKFEEWCKERESSSTTRASAAHPTIPDSLKCPLSLSVMQDPVVAEDGHTYERRCIERWFSTGNRTSPLTRERMGTKLIPSHTLKKLIEELGCTTV